jgi:L-seryl-tRNA(Ser) seleniumtransferase
MSTINTLLRQLPKVDLVMGQFLDGGVQSAPESLVKSAIRTVLDGFRSKVLAGSITSLPAGDDEWTVIFSQAIEDAMQPNLRRVLNGTGVVIHTNLGRSLLGPSSIDALQTAGACFTNLEFDIRSGKRGSRYSLVEKILCDLTGAESALVVNNNAAAVLLALNTLSLNKETVVSRGQLVEIGGSFRIPDVMASSGARMVEVGATNRTHLFDYENVIGEETALLLKVHTSNFRVIGFTSEVSAAELAVLGSSKEIPVMEDLGSGSLVDLSPWGFPKEPTVQEIVKAGVDVVTFSGDKLLGGPQAGIIVGKKTYIDRLKTNPMNRALRIDKFTLASLETVLREYYDITQATDSVPTLAMLTAAPEVLKKKGQRILRRLKGIGQCKEKISLEKTISKVGGGAMPEHGMPSWALVVKDLGVGASHCEKWFRNHSLPLIVRIEDEKIIVDLRTILQHDEALLVEIMKEYLLLFRESHSCSSGSTREPV